MCSWSVVSDMGEETAQLNQLISDAIEVQSITGEDDVRAMYDFARALPSHAVEYLLSAKVPSLFQNFQTFCSPLVLPIDLHIFLALTNINRLSM